MKKTKIYIIMVRYTIKVWQLVSSALNFNSTYLYFRRIYTKKLPEPSF